MMKGKWFKWTLFTALVMLVGLLGAAATGSAKTNSTAAAGYVGSQACFGCHSGKFDKWHESGHANMVVRVMQTDDLPGPVDAAPDDLKAELNRAAYIVAGHRFIARDSKTGELSYLNVQWDSAASQYVPYKGGSSWEQGCAGCHSTGIQTDKDISGVEMGIGCEACHGPGRDHIKGKGDKTKIQKNNEAVTCGRCHNKGTSDDGSKWPNGWKIGMQLEDVGYHLTPVAKTDIPPTNLRQMSNLVVSGHLEAVQVLNESDHARDTCYVCHSATARIAADKGKPIKDLDVLRNLTDGVSCSACHDPHGDAGNEAQLRMPPEKLCESCHTSGLAEGTTLKVGGAAHHAQKEMFEGYGAIGLPQTKGVHSGNNVSCYQCHMTGANHMFKVILPKDVEGTDQKDSCTACHTKSTSTIRGAYLEMWQDSTMRKLDYVKDLIAAADAQIKANPDTPAHVVEKFKTAQTNITIIEADKSKGAHNFEYAMTILDAAERALKEIGAR